MVSWIRPESRHSAAVASSAAEAATTAPTAAFIEAHKSADSLDGSSSAAAEHLHG
jgi:hypothetical protein